MADLINQNKSGTYVGTGAALTITLGWQPNFVSIFNQTDGDTLVFGYGAATAATGVSVTTPAAIANGITFVASGFSLGTDVSVNENTKTFVYFAY